MVTNMGIHAWDLLTDSKAVVANAMAVSSQLLPPVFQSQPGSGHVGGTPIASPSKRSAGRTAQTGTLSDSQQQHESVALESELSAMRAEITGLECVLGLFKVGSFDIEPDKLFAVRKIGSVVYFNSYYKTRYGYNNLWGYTVQVSEGLMGGSLTGVRRSVGHHPTQRQLRDRAERYVREAPDLIPSSYPYGSGSATRQASRE